MDSHLRIEAVSGVNPRSLTNRIDSEWGHFLWRPNLPDEADNHLIELALAGAAESIVTTNLKDLRQGELRFPGLKIQTPHQFLTTLP